MSSDRGREHESGPDRARPIATRVPEGSPAAGFTATAEARPGVGGRIARFGVALHHPAYRLLWASMAASMFAIQMQTVATAWLAFDLTGSLPRSAS